MRVDVLESKKVMPIETFMCKGKIKGRALGCWQIAGHFSVVWSGSSPMLRQDWDIMEKEIEDKDSVDYPYDDVQISHVQV